MKKLLLTFLFILILQNTIFAAGLLPNQPFTLIELDDSNEHGFQRLVKVIKETKGIDCKATALKQITVTDHPDIKSHYKLTLESDISWINGHWVIDLVPYTIENMSIQKAKSWNPEYDWWFTYYNNGQPEAIAWARYGH